MSNSNKIIGRVTATEKSPTTSTTLRFWVDPDTRVRPFDIVRIEHLGRNSEKPSSTYAMVKELEFLTDGAGYLASFVSSDFGDVSVEPRTDRIGTTVASADVLYNSHGIEMPVKDSSAVYWADADGVREALGLKNFRNRVPAGYFQMSNGEEIAIDFENDFLVGPEGAHLNVAGISGLATKTSYAMFLMSGLQQTYASDISFLIFNVKGRDLLSLDVEREDLNEKTKSDWKRCGLEAKPFSNVSYYYPFKNDANAQYTQSRAEKEILQNQIECGTANNLFYDVEDGVDRLHLLFSDIDDPQSTMESCIFAIKDMKPSSWEDLIEKVRGRTEGGSGGEIAVQSWRKFYRILKTRRQNDIFTERAQIKASEKRQKSTIELVNSISKGSVTVVDIEPLPDYLQCMIVGDLIDLILKAKLGENDDIEPSEMGRVVIFADELNKYAPKSSGGARTLTNTLLEVTERGRSLGTVLFGAEQIRSGVHDRVLGNCSTSAFGRTNPIEIQKGQEYRLLTNPQKASLVRLPKGTLMLQHPLFTASVIKAQFPEPAYHQPK